MKPKHRDKGPGALNLPAKEQTLPSLLKAEGTEGTADKASASQVKMKLLCCLLRAVAPAQPAGVEDTEGWGVCYPAAGTDSALIHLPSQPGALGQAPSTQKGAGYSEGTLKQHN